jgi:hypothetical protein
MCHPLIRKASATLFQGSFQAGKALQAISREVRDATAAFTPQSFGKSKDSLEGFPR